MSWVGSTGFVRRPLVIAEDHLHHVSELLAILAETSPGLLSQTTVLCLDRPGPDTTRLAAGWLERYSGLQVAARFETDVPEPLRPRRVILDAAVFESANRFAKALAGLLRSG